MKSYSADGKLGSTRVREYDKKNLIKESVYMNGRTLLNTSTYMYDSNGNQIESMTTDEKGLVTYRETMKYDKYHNVIKEISYNSNGTVAQSESTYKYKYDSYGNYTQVMCFENSFPDYMIERTFQYY